MGILKSEEALRAMPGFDPAFHLGIGGPKIPWEAEDVMPFPEDCDEVKVFMPWVTALAEAHGWEVWHCRITRFSKAGFWDFELCRPPRLLKIELKSMHGVLTPEQKKWLNLYRKCPGIEAHVFWPKDWRTIRELLK
jgi:hypothetical protein